MTIIMIKQASLKSRTSRGRDAANKFLAHVPFSLPPHVPAAAAPGPPLPAVRMHSRSQEPVFEPSAPAASPCLALPRPVKLVVLGTPSSSARDMGPMSGADTNYIQPPSSAWSVQSLEEEEYWGARCRLSCSPKSGFFACHACYDGQADHVLLPNPHCGACRAEWSSPKR